MSLNLNIPITQTLTLPDNWQACKTPQELSYWIVAKFEGFTSSLTDINNALSQLNSMIETNTNNIATNDAEMAKIKTSIANINTTIGEINTSIESINSDYGLLHSNYMAMNNRLAIVEDVVGDIPAIKNDITELQTNVSTLQTNTSKNADDIAGLQTSVNSNASMIQTNSDKIFAVTKPYYYRDRTGKLFSWNFGNTTSASMVITSVNYRTFIDISAESDLGHTFIIYYYSTNNIPFGTYDSNISGTDIISAMEETSIDGKAFKTEILANTKVAIRFFYTGIVNDVKTYSWTVL